MVALPVAFAGLVLPVEALEDELGEGEGDEVDLGVAVVVVEADGGDGGVAGDDFVGEEGEAVVGAEGF